MMNKERHTTISIILVLLFGSVIFYIGTDGFQAFTAETARTNELNHNKPSLPSVTLEDSRERTYTLTEFARDKHILITFMYTNCGTVCPQLEMNMAEVYDLIPTKYIGKDIAFLSISFDTTRDDPETLAKYRTYFGSDGETWRMARVNDQTELDRLLDTLGVVAIPDGYGNYQHNAAFYLTGRNGHLQEVMDFTKIEEAANTVVTALREGESK